MQKGPPEGGPFRISLRSVGEAYWPEFEAGAIGAVAEASFEAALAAIAEFDDIELDDAIAALVSVAAAVFSVAAGLLQAARAARAAPTITMERSVPEVILLVPSGEGLAAPARDAGPAI